MRTPKFDKDYCRQIARANEGISFVCYEPEEDAYFFQSGDYRNGFYEYRLLEQDMTEENARFMFEKGLSNTNKSSNL